MLNVSLNLTVNTAICTSCLGRIKNLSVVKRTITYEIGLKNQGENGSFSELTGHLPTWRDFFLSYFDGQI